VAAEKYIEGARSVATPEAIAAVGAPSDVM